MESKTAKDIFEFDDGKVKYNFLIVFFCFKKWASKAKNV